MQPLTSPADTDGGLEHSPNRGGLDYEGPTPEDNSDFWGSPSGPDRAKHFPTLDLFLTPTHFAFVLPKNISVTSLSLHFHPTDLFRTLSCMVFYNGHTTGHLFSVLSLTGIFAA